ncbi:unnamed protein product [Blepharisma stoltei]|uniref:Ubiquitin-like domain-containing protein n=1 Tax=Blepharisma stoltei TaxID=1481888 RepID=A0AAU9K8B7_9CILI|nr:unnamed protein product [Blepharisma stoltei]
MLEERHREQAEYVTLKVRSQNGNEMFFKIKRLAHLRKLIEVYCAKAGIIITTTRFLFQGERIMGRHTAELLGLENGDEIIAVSEQIGGCY